MLASLKRFRPLSAAVVLLLAGCTTMRAPSSGDVAAVEAALKLLLVDENVQVEPQVPARTNQLRNFQTSLARAQIEDRLCLRISAAGGLPAPAEFSTKQRRLTLRPCRSPSCLSVNSTRRGTEDSLRMSFSATTEWTFRLTIESGQKTNLVFLGVVDSYGPPTIPAKPPVLEIPRPPS
jgi:hypothetical protein